MPSGLDVILLKEMEDEDHQENMTDDFSIIDLMYDEDNNELSPSIFSKQMIGEEE